MVWAYRQMFCLYAQFLLVIYGIVWKKLEVWAYKAEVVFYAQNMMKIWARKKALFSYTQNTVIMMFD